MRIRSVSLSALAAALCLAGPARAVTIDFDTLPNFTVLSSQYPEVTFSSEPGFVPIAFGLATLLGTSPPQVLAVITADLSTPALAREVVLDFTAPVSGLTFNVAGVHNTGTIAQMDLFQNGAYSTTVNMIGASNMFTPLFVDLAAFDNLTRLRFYNITDTLGIAYDDFSFRVAPAAAVPEPGTLALLAAGFPLGAAVLRRRRA